MNVRTVMTLALCLLPALPGLHRAEAAENMFANPSFEWGRASWRADKAGKTEARFVADRKDAAVGEYSALVTVGAVENWGVQFGQSIDAGKRGKTYTFAVFAKAVTGPVPVQLEVERRGKPYDRAGRGRRVILKKGEWTELHVTFTVKADFRQGWFAYISCTQANSQFRADMFRLYEGKYVPYRQLRQEDAALGGVKLLDTGKSSTTPLSSAAFARRAGWLELPEDKLAHAFKGDAVLLNNKLAVVLRRGGGGAEVYAAGPKDHRMHAVLTPVGQTPSAKLSAVQVVQNTPNGVKVIAAFKGADARLLLVAYKLKMGQPLVETEPLGRVTGMRIEAPSRFVVLPDFFADDIVVDATALPVTKAHLPSENFLLHLAADGGGIVMAVRDVRGGDALVTLSGQKSKRLIQSSELAYGTKGKIWVAVMAGTGIWHTRDVAANEATKVVRLGWTAPYPAQWRVDWRRSDDLTDSWEMITEKPRGGYVKHGWFGSPGAIPANRRRWTTVLGNFKYPCWVDRTGRGFLQPLKHRELTFLGPAVLYPINRAQKTPLDVFTVVDIVRQSLGVGPCEYILDLEGQKQQYRGRATCSARDNLRRIYYSGKVQKKQEPEVEKNLREVLIFIKYIRGRINDYVRFGHELLAYLAEQKKAHPELAGFVTEMETLTRRIDARVARRIGKIKTPKYAEQLIERFRTTLVGYEGRDAYQKCKKLTADIVVVGSNQDELVGECRWVVKALRQRAGIAMAVNPKAAGVAAEIRKRTQKILRNPASHEGSHH